MAGEAVIELVEDKEGLADIVNLRRRDVSESDEELEEWHFRKLEKMMSDGNHFWIARQESKPIGYASGSLIRNSYFSRNIYVVPEHRREGIGLSLKRVQLSFAESTGCDKVYTFLTKDNTASKKMQKKMGFEMEKVGEYHYKAVLPLNQ